MSKPGVLSTLDYIDNVFFFPSSASGDIMIGGVILPADV